MLIYIINNKQTKQETKRTVRKKYIFLVKSCKQYKEKKEEEVLSKYIETYSIRVRRIYKSVKEDDFWA